MKVFVQKQDSKFVNNLILSLKHKNVDVVSSDIKQDLYKIYHYFHFNVGIFLASKFTNEIAQFISEFHTQDTKFFIYHDILNKEVLQDFSKAAEHFTHTQLDNTIYIPTLINDVLYNNTKTERKKNSYAVFLDNAREIPEDLNDLLYPNTKLHINMFNSHFIQHYQNVGSLTEIEKAGVLNTYEFLININNDYTQEAIACGCKPISIQELKEKKKPKYKADKNIMTYQTFIDTNIL